MTEKGWMCEGCDHFVPGYQLPVFCPKCQGTRFSFVGLEACPEDDQSNCRSEYHHWGIRMHVIPNG